ncbi:MAG: ribosomal L7Ae/L30e/S12e/Gadd45 family protein [Clostridiales bacterium]|nr:ribosomal L7Ae/L30e/S12e/Gadd45 family protein [Clostridiales bacterium]
MDERKFRGMIGLSAKAGRLKSGEFCSEQSIKSGRARLCLLAADTSDRTKKHFTDMCSYRSIPIRTMNVDKEALGHMIGRGPRSSAVVEDEGFAERIVGLIDGGNF